MRLPVSLEGGMRPADFSKPIGESEFISEPAAFKGPGRVDEPGAFETLFLETVGKTNRKLETAEQSAKDFASGKSDDIHGTMIAVTQADIQLRLVGSMRNKVVEAFNEIWRMQI